MRRFLLLALLDACSFTRGVPLGGDGGPIADGADAADANGGGDALRDGPMQDGQVDALPIDGPPNKCFGTTVAYTVCLTTLPGGGITLGNQTFNTSAGQCAGNTPAGQVVTVNGVPMCAVAGTTVTVTGNFRAEGTLPLVIVATTGNVTVNSGAIVDVSSSRGATPGANADSSACPVSPAGTNGSGAGGGAGGSFGTKGGDGGDGNGAGGGAAPNATGATGLRGGCRAGDGGSADGNQGTGGHGGGAVYLIAKGTLMITGAVNASGGGSTSASGSRNGGGGGGSGGMIALFGASLAITGPVFANGGGGGGGAESGTSGPGGESPGPTNAASGGAGAGMMVGDGGAGAVGAGTGGIGTNGNKGAGGGGGGVGVIKNLTTSVIGGANFSPQPS